MPRRLPWLAQGAKKKETTKAEITPLPVSRRGRDSSRDNLVDADLNSVVPETPKPLEKKRPARTPSTSPPPAPPDVEYMREGFNADDVFMMVEDEFLSTAKMFTQHLHHAEYVKFKKLAKARGEEVLQAIQRPVDGRTKRSTASILHHEAEEQAKKIKAALKGDGDESSEDEYMRDPQLAGLMQGMNVTSKDLSSMTKGRANTRAAAGFEQSPRNLERTKDVFADSTIAIPTPALEKARKLIKKEVHSEEEDDPDAVPSKPRISGDVKFEDKPSRYQETSRDRLKSSDMPNSGKSSIFKRYSKASEDPYPTAIDRKDTDSRSSKPQERRFTSPPLKSEPNWKPTKSPSASDYLAKRRAEREKKDREEKRKTATTIDIPTFAI